MSFLGVDLAARFSAAVLLDESGKVVLQFDSWGRDAWDFCALLAGVAKKHDVRAVMLEDLPYGLSRQSQIKPPLRVQGMAIAFLDVTGMLDRTYFLDPSTWQRSFEGVWKGKAEGATTAALRYGYVAPVLLTEYADDVPPLGKEHSKARSKIRANLKKASTDYNDSFLIAEYSRQKYLAEGLDNLKGVQKVARL